eukprot:TRINITY_DN22123_c0_g1_i1.p1 TRINITY_DN22123_c0_g1~~TRINITY_DN22123_c0_g1_i1.p1  ORF type:complete len:218 (+),score=41.83 TRINITY_DN22123_c0_g1_i1:584-1237(+)
MLGTSSSAMEALSMSSQSDTTEMVHAASPPLSLGVGQMGPGGAQFRGGGAAQPSSHLSVHPSAQPSISSSASHALAMANNGTSGSGGSSGGASPCAACKLLRRRCTKECLFAPYFPTEEPQRFANVHRVFGASNVAKMLQDLPEQLRSDAASSLAYEADARVRDPVYGCVGSISALQQQVAHLQANLTMVHAEMTRLQALSYDASSGASSDHTKSES